MGRTEPTEKGATARKNWWRNHFSKKMPETTVPVSLRDAFLEDPFFRTGWDEMNSECREMRSFAEGNNTLATMDRSWPLLPKQWMLPQLFQDFHLPEMKDSLMLGLQEEKDKMEVTLDASGYKPDELKVEIKEGELCVEGKHEERSQTGEVMVSRQFSRRFGMPQNVKKEGIVSNLSQDGVMVITMPKEQRIEEVERGNTPIQVDHVRSSSERKTMAEEASAKVKGKRFQTRAGWTTLTVPVRCKGDEEASPRPAGRETPAGQGRRPPLLKLERKTRNVRQAPVGAQVGEERWWLRGEMKGRRGVGAGRGTSRFQ